MYDNFKTANYSKSLVSPEMYGRHLSRLFDGEVVDGFTAVPGTGMQVVLKPGNAFVRYGSANVASARIVSLVDDFALSIDAADASNPRHDLVVVYIDNAVDLPDDDPPDVGNLDGPGVAKAIIVKGAASATPADPDATAIQAAVGSGNPYTVLVRVVVGAGVAVIGSGDIEDLRTLATVGPDKRSGGVYGVTHTFADATGTQTVTGVPFAPTSVEVLGDADDTTGSSNYTLSTGRAVLNDDGEIYQASKSLAVASSGSTGTTLLNDDAFIYRPTSSGAVIYDVRVTGFTSDGIEVNVATSSGTASRRTWSLVFRR